MVFQGDNVTSMLTGFHHVTLRVTDLSRARVFYEGVLIQWELFEQT
jgi:hypothetical protein